MRSDHFYIYLLWWFIYYIYMLPILLFEVIVKETTEWSIQTNKCIWMQNKIVSKRINEITSVICKRAYNKISRGNPINNELYCSINYLSQFATEEWSLINSISYCSRAFIIHSQGGFNLQGCKTILDPTFIEGKTMGETDIFLKNFRQIIIKTNIKSCPWSLKFWLFFLD